MPVASEVVVRLVGKTKKFEASMRRSTKVVGGLSKSAGVARAGMGKLILPLLAAGAAALSARRLFGGLMQEFKRIQTIAKTADKLGITTEALTGLQFAAEQTGVATNVLDTAIQRMVRRVSEASRGLGATGNALLELNLAAKDLAKLSPDEQFGRIADAMAGVATQGDRVRLAMALFDTEGVSLVNTLALGSEGLDKMRRDMKRLGGTFSRKDAFGVERAGDALKRFAIARRGVLTQLAIKAAPAIEALADNFTSIAADAVKHLRTAVGLTEFFAKSAAMVVDVWDALVITVKGLGVVMLASLAAQAKAISLLVNVANKLPGIDIDTSGLDTFSQNAFLAGQDMVKEIRAAFNAPTKLSQVDDLFSDINQAFDKIGKLGGKGKAALSEIDLAALKFIETLSLQNKAIGMTSTQFRIAQFEAKGLDSSVVQLIKNLAQVGFNKARAQEFQDTLKAMQQQVINFNKTQLEIQTTRFRGFVSPEELGRLETATKLLNTLGENLQRKETKLDFIRNLFDSTRTPMEQFKKRLQELIDLQREGVLESDDLFDRAVLKARKETLGIVTTVQSPKALERGTAAAFTAVNQSKRQNVADRLLEAQLKQMQEDALIQAKLLKVAQDTNKKLEPASISR